MLKFRGDFQIFLEIPIFRAHAPGNSLLGAIFSIGHDLAGRNYDDDDRLKWSSLRRVSAIFAMGAFPPRLTNAFESFFRRGEFFRTPPHLGPKARFLDPRRINGFSLTRKPIYLVGIAFQIIRYFYATRRVRGEIP